ncbi:MAG: hypothetical protein Q9161_003452 [Pseudevernia consocians]
MADHFGGVIPSADDGNSQSKAIYGAVITVTVLATIAVIFRFVARRKSEAVISYDDYSILLALIFLYGLNIDTIVAAALWGLGQDVFTMSKDQLLHFQKNGLANFALYFTTNATIKISLLLLYYRLFSPSHPFRIAVYTTGVIVIAWWIAVFFADIFQCVPANAFWNFEAQNAKTARCMSTITFSIGTGVSNLVTDIMVLCLPMPMVWSLRTDRTQKLTLTGIFLLGFFVCAISIIRIVKLVAPGHSDPTYSLASVFIWTCVEPSVGIISACLPIMPLAHLTYLTSESPPRFGANETSGPLFGRWLLATVPSRTKMPSSKKTKSSSQPPSTNLTSPVKVGFSRLEGPTYRDQLEAAYRAKLETSSGRNGSVVPVANGNYGDKEGRSWVMFGTSEGDGADSRLEEGRGVEEFVEMREWPRRRGGGE